MRSEMLKNWRERYFALDQDELKFYTKKGAPVKGLFQLANIVEATAKSDIVGSDSAHDRPNHFVVVTAKRNIHLAANSHSEMEAWIQALNAKNMTYGMSGGDAGGIGSRGTSHRLSMNFFHAGGAGGGNSLNLDELRKEEDA